MSRATELHRRAMALADRAILQSRAGEVNLARDVYREAFVAEREAAASAVAEGLGEPTISVLHRSAATLALDAGEVREAERLIALALCGEPPEEIANELRDLWEQVYFERHLSLRGVRLATGEFQFAVTGQAVGLGIVKSDEFTDRVDTVESMLYRTAERRLKRPYRDAGRRKAALEQEIGVYLSVPRAASFAVTFRVGLNTQLSLLPDSRPLADELIDDVLTCVDLLNRGDQRGVREMIPEPAYFTNFVSLARNLAPDGKRITSVAFTASARGKERKVSLLRRRDHMPVPGETVAGGLPAVIDLNRDYALPTPPEDVVITGRLSYADELEAHNEIRIEPSDGGAPERIQVPEGMMSDIVKPLWGVRVTVRGIRIGSVVLLQSIDQDE